MNQFALIAGAWPVGLTLACELTHYRVPIRIVDKAPHRTNKSKAIALWSRTLELLDRDATGSAPFVEAGFKVDAGWPRGRLPARFILYAASDLGGQDSNAPEKKS
jgi:hypothetical protein